MEKNKNSGKMEIRHCLYTLLLIITCFIASPMIVGKIWKSSAEVKKKTEHKPKVEQVTEAVPEIEVVTEETTGEAEAVTEAATEAETEPATEEAKADAVNYVQSDYFYFSDALFIGDSRMVGIRDYGTIDNAGYFCDVGLATYNLYDEPHGGYYLDEIFDGGVYGKVYIMLGINEVENDFEYTINLYRSLVEKVRIRQPNAVIYLMANLHVAENAESGGITNENINELNRLMAGLADNNMIYYLDSNELFDDETGAMDESITGDGLHIKAEYYDEWCSWLYSHTVVPGT